MPLTSAELRELESDQDVPVSSMVGELGVDKCQPSEMSDDWGGDSEHSGKEGNTVTHSEGSPDSICHSNQVFPNNYLSKKEISAFVFT